MCHHGPGACSPSEGCAGNPAPAVGSTSIWRAEAGSQPGWHRRLQLTWCQVSPGAACRAVTGAVSQEGLPAGQNWTPAVPTTPRPAGGLPAIRVTARPGPCPKDSPLRVAGGGQGASRSSQRGCVFCGVSNERAQPLGGGGDVRPRSASQSGRRGQETYRECKENDHKVRRGGGGNIYSSSRCQALSQALSLRYYT